MIVYATGVRYNNRLIKMEHILYDIVKHTVSVIVRLYVAKYYLDLTPMS
jgi:hypothetical protein